MAGRIDAETRRKANLRVLQRIDSNIVDLAITATHVVLYEFNNAKQRWEKKNVEGWLALTKRSEAPRFKLIVLNRSSTENLEVPITASFQMQVKEPYMIFRDSKASSSSGSGSSTNGGADESIRGIWFHDGKERDQIASYLEQVVKSLVKIEEMERNHAPTTTEALVDNDDDDEEAARQDAGAALLSTLTLGSANNGESTMSVTSAAVHPPSRQGHAVPVAGQQQPQQHAATTTTTTSSTHQNLVLDKKSLQLSLLSLIQDERFLDLIHAQYLKVVHTRAARQQQQQSQPKENNGTNM